MSKMLVDVRILKKKFPGKYDHIESGRVEIGLEEIQAFIPAGASSPGPKTVVAPVAIVLPGGPGTELKAILKDWLGVQASPNCSCNARAKQMDEWGPDLCEQNLETIVDWLEEQAKARKLPFVRFAASQAVKLAIRRARKKAAK